MKRSHPRLQRHGFPRCYLVVAGLLAKNNPEEPAFGLFDIAVLGAPCALVGVLYMAIWSRYVPSPLPYPNPNLTRS